LPRRIACVFAHPDDETFAVGGTLAHYAATGVGCDLFCATDGDAGRSSGVAVSSRAELASLRRDELRAAARALNIDTIVFAGHPDGALGQVDQQQLIGEIVRFLRSVRPSVVLSFGPEGAPTGHRDHRAVSRAATAAFFLSGLATEYPDQLSQDLEPYRPSRLFYVAWRPPPPEAALKLLSVPATAAISITERHQQKLAAFMAHTTQRDHYDRFVELGLTEFEYYALAAGVAQPQAMISDLFEGLTSSS
jgi:LmbE family N-acetylglucosaminyl deacetylase